MLPWLLVAAQQSGAGFFDAPASQGRSSTVFNNGEECNGQYYARANGGLDWVSLDAGGTSVEDSWWTPEETVSGTWHVRIEHQGVDDNQISPSSPSDLDTWYAMGVRYDFRKLTSGTGGGSTSGTYDVLFSDDGGTTTHHTTELSITLNEPTL